MKLLEKQYLVAAALAFGALLTSIAKADLMPRHRTHPRHSEYRCAELAGDANGPDSAKLQTFLNDPKYKHSSAPTTTKLDNGNYRVCAVFEL